MLDAIRSTVDTRITIKIIFITRGDIAGNNGLFMKTRTQRFSPEISI
jgi:hypothetical protein